MEELLDVVYHQKKTPINSDRLRVEAENLSKAGFQIPARQLLARSYGFLPISLKQIETFLRKKIHFPSQEFRQTYHRAYKMDCGCLRYSLQGWVTIEKPYTGIFGPKIRKEEEHRAVDWFETPINDYSKIPPANVVQKLEEIKQLHLFDYFVVATFNKQLCAKNEYLTESKDPLLMGRFKNDTTRFLIYQWDDDIILDDLI